MDMISSTTSNTNAPSTLQNKQEAAMVASPPREEAAAARNVKAKQAWQQQMAASGGGERKPRPQQEQGLNCPRCDSTNTKFCYYNNNSMTQPRYFCKACRRNWTQGGTLRKVPIGGSSRKNKQSRAGGSSSSSSSAPPAPSSTSNDSNKMNLTQQLMMMPTTTTPMPANFPNVLPTFMSAGSGSFGELPGSDHHSLPFPPLSLPSNPTGTMPSLVGILRGGFPDGGMAALPFLPVPPSFGAMHQHGHGMMGGSSDQQLVGPLQGIDQALKLPLAAACGSGPQQWPSSAAPEQQVVGGDGRADKNNNNNGGGATGSSSGVEYYWQGSI